MSYSIRVRESWEYSMAKIDGSVLVSLGELPQSLDQLGDQKRGQSLFKRPFCSYQRSRRSQAIAGIRLLTQCAAEPARLPDAIIACW